MSYLHYKNIASLDGKADPGHPASSVPTRPINSEIKFKKETCSKRFGQNVSLKTFYKPNPEP